MATDAASGPGPVSGNGPEEHTYPSPGRAWVITATVLLGTFMSVMDVSVVNVALPHMMGNFSATLSAITWVATSYSIAEIITATMAGWWSAVIGRRRLYLVSMWIFVAGSALAGMSQTFAQMLVFRTLQGIGGGALIPLAMANIREAFPERTRGMAMAAYGMGVVLAPAFGPVIGGWLTDNYGWPAIFYINIPFGLLGLVMVWLFIENPPHLRRGVSHVDWQGIALLTLGLTGLQVVLERGQEENWFESDLIVAGTVATVVCLSVLVWWELRVRDPVVQLRLLKISSLSLACAIVLIFGIALFGSTFFLPQLTQELLGYTAFDAGMTLMPRAAVLFVCFPIAGALFGRVDSRLMILSGFVLVWLSFQQLSQLSLQVGYWNIAPILMLMGAGMPFMFVTLSTTSLAKVHPADSTQASAIYTLAQRVGGNAGYAIVATLLARGTQINRSWLVENISPLNPWWGQAYGVAKGSLQARGLGPHQAQETAYAVANMLVNQQARMLAYNRAAVVLGMLVLLAVPLVFFLPGRIRGVQPVAGE